jgi:hypothetical protein
MKDTIKGGAELLPFSSVIRSARCRALINEKCPVSEESNVFCLSIATISQIEMQARSSSNSPGSEAIASLPAPPLAVEEVLFDMI